MATREEIIANAKKLEAAGAPSSEIEKYVSLASREMSSTAVPQERGLMGRAYDALAVPEAKAREGLNMIAGALPESYTGNTVRDIAVNAPRIAAETLAEVAPGFISRGSMLTAGALKGAQLAAPAINAFGRFAGRTAESMSGLGYRTPGVLAEAVKDPTLIFGKGVSKARELYKGVQNVNQISPELQSVSSNKPFVVRALKMAREGNLTPDEALEARKALDALDNVPDVFRKQTRSVFDALAKQKFAEADKAYSRAVKSEALRQFWGINKGGTPSIVKGGISLGLPVLSPLLSPVMQGATASAIGATGKVSAPFLRNPRLGLLGKPVLDEFRR